MLNLLKRVGILAALGTMTAVACAQGADAGVDLLKKMEEQFRGVKSVAGGFTQKGSGPFSKAAIPVRFELLKPSYFKAEYYEGNVSSPARIQLISDQMYYQYTPALKQVNTYKFKNSNSINDLSFLLLGFGAKTEDVTQIYKVESVTAGKTIRLTPRNAAGATYRFITMSVDPQSLYPTQFTMMQTDNTELKVDLNRAELQINAPITAKNFEPTFLKQVPKEKIVPID